jgi:hypothetical protein
MAGREARRGSGRAARSTASDGNECRDLSHWSKRTSTLPGVPS